MHLRGIPPLLLITLAFSCGSPTQQPGATAEKPADSLGHQADTTAFLAQAAGFRVVSTGPVVFAFANGDTLNTGLQDFDQASRITDPLGRQWLLFRGSKDHSSTTGRSLYVLSSGEIAARAALQYPWHLPGRLIAADANKSYYEAEVFAGEVLPDTVGVVWYERALMPDGQWRMNTTLLNLNGTRPDTLVFFGHGRMSSTMGLAFKGKCRKLPGVDQQVDLKKAR